MFNQTIIAAITLSTLGAIGAKPETDAVVANVFRPTRRHFSEERMQQLKLPPRLKINVFAKDMGHARMLAIAEDGTVFLTRPAQGIVSALRDENGDGVAEKNEEVITGIKEVHGITLHDNFLYIATTKQLLRAPLSGGKPGKPEILIKDFPDGGQHSKRTIAFGPDGALYFSVGSSCNNCEEENPEHATILRIDPKSWQRKIFAKGLRNTIGFAWHPQTKEFWGMDHGSDDRGYNVPPEELNLLKENSDYGWPFCFGQNIIVKKANEPKSGTKEEHCAKAIAPELEYQAHSAPIDFAFYTGSIFPAEYRNDAFFASRGSWNRKPATGYKIVRIHFENGKPVAFQDFVSGFLIEDGQAFFGRLAGVAVAKDGSLLFSDDTNGVIYRVSYSNPAK
ncbi:MAG: PQQ-dependent sugar dehydrogenase [Verrucomicrobiota bacterium]